jgi:hypothetical protein
LALRTKILGTACAIALTGFVVSPAMADASNFSAVLNADYAHTSVDGAHANTWNFSGTGALDTNILWNMSLQGELGYSSATFGDEGEGFHSSDLYWNLSPFWRTDWGRVGAVFGENAHDYYGDFTPHTMNYGAYAEWYLSPNLTLAIKGGGWTEEYYSGISNNSDGYVGGEAVWYVMPDIALTGTIDYTGYPNDYFFSDGESFSETDYGIKAEWLVSETTPISIYASWVNQHVDHETANTWTIGLKLYLNQGDASTLVDRQRSGSSEWNTSFSPVVDNIAF